MLLLIILMAGPAIEGDANLLALMQDAQRAYENRYPRGELTAEVEVGFVGSKNPSQVVDGRLTWDGKKSLFRGNRWSNPKTAEFPEGHPQTAVFAMIRDEKTISSHGLKAKIVRIASTSKVGPPPYDPVPPDEGWFGQKEATRPWIELLGPHPSMPQDGVKRYVVKRLDDDRIELTREDHDGSRLRWVASQRDDGQIVEHECDSATTVDRAHSRYRWARDAKGRLYLAESEYDWTHISPPNAFDKEERTVHWYKKYKTTAFNPDLRPDPSLFNNASFKSLPGVRVEDEVAGKTYRTGDLPAKTIESGLDGLVEGVRSKGFARPPKD